MIRIYQAVSNPYKMPNPFVYALTDGINDLYGDISWGWGYETFWTDQIFNYDVILFHWPEALLFWSGDSQHSVNDLKKRICEIKSKGMQLISFVHNIQPHYCLESSKIECYELVYSSASVLLHMGNSSISIMGNRYPNAKHVNIGYHFVYDKIYKDEFTKIQACSKLGLSQKYNYVLAFGTFRDDEERELVTKLAHDLYQWNKNIIVLAPCYTNIPPQKIRFDFLPRFRKFLIKQKKHIICSGQTFNTVPESMLPYYYAAADICFIPRKRILNSGNVPMALLMSKVVVGPDIGNVGEVLKEMDNPVFNINDQSDIFNSVIRALKLAKNHKGKWNHDYALNHFSTDFFCKKLHAVLTQQNA